MSSILFMNSSRKRSWLRWLVILVCALILLFVAKSCWIDLRFVPSISMEPTLMEGEWILVNKTYPRESEPQLFDLVMFESPETHTPYLKRIAGLPGSKIEVLKGDLFCDRQIVHKSLDQFFHVAVTMFDSREGDLGRDWGFQPDRVSQDWSKAIFFQGQTTNKPAAIQRKELYLSETLKNSPGAGQEPAHDAAIEIRFTAPASGVLYAVLGEEGDQFGFELQFRPDVSGGLLTRTAKSKTEVLREKHLPVLAPGSQHTLFIANLDNRLLFLLDGEEFLPAADYEQNNPYTMFDAGTEKRLFPPSTVLLGARDGNITVNWFRLLRDVDYSSTGSIGIGEPCELGPDEYYVLGDNSCCSEDSRSFGPIRRSSILGKPFAVIYPISLIRKL